MEARQLNRSLCFHLQMAMITVIPTSYGYRRAEWNNSVKHLVGCLACRKYSVKAIVLTGSTTYRLEGSAGPSTGLLTCVWGKTLPSASLEKGDLVSTFVRSGSHFPERVEKRYERAHIKNFTGYLAPSWGSVNSSSYYNTCERV